jgi:hypothetical protein
MCLAAFAPRLPALEDCPSLLQDLAARWCVGAAKYGAAPALAGTEGQKPPAQCWDGRLTVGLKTTGVGGEARGYDGGKKVRGRKRHLLVDTEGLVLKASGALRIYKRSKRF